MLTEAFILKKYGHVLLTVDEVAELFRREPGTIKNQIAQGKIALEPVGGRKSGEAARFHYAAVARAIDAYDESLSTPA